MVIEKIRKMSVKCVKLKSESCFSISPGVLELWRKNLSPTSGKPRTQVLAETILITQIFKNILKQKRHFKHLL